MHSSSAQEVSITSRRRVALEMTGDTGVHQRAHDCRGCFDDAKVRESSNLLQMLPVTMGAEG